jgi:hypothetical protein
MKTTQFFALCLLFLSLAACDKENEVSVNADLQPYFESFAVEAKARNRSVEMGHVSGDIAVLNENNVAAKCQSLASGHKNVLVDEKFWKTADAMAREMVVFHELGHCALSRPHTDATKADGSCESMMQSGTGLCKMIYNSKTRSAYLDELFK